MNQLLSAHTKPAPQRAGASLATRRIRQLALAYASTVFACAPATSDDSSAFEAAQQPALGRVSSAQPPTSARVADAAPASAGRVHDPGRGPWQRVPRSEVRARCKLDPDLLDAADELLGAPYAVVRYGLLCHSHQVSEDDAPGDALSLTKLLGALVTGRVSYATRELPRHGRKTGPFRDLDRVDHWLDDVPYNPDAHVAHVLGMVAQNEDLSLGHKKMEYDFFGNVQINSLSEMLNAALRQRPARLAPDLDTFVEQQLFDPLGMRSSSWSWGLPDKLFAFTWNTNVLDEARLGLLILHSGLWSGERLVDDGYIERMTHPSFEDANTAWGYLTWLNASARYTLGGMPGDVPEHGPMLPGPCAPTAVFGTYPHGLSESADCNYGAEYSCEQEHDVGVWQGIGISGKVVQGHPGLDLLLVGDNLAPLTFGAAAPALLWDAVRPALIAADPIYQGDERAFCEAYGKNQYAPDR